MKQLLFIVALMFIALSAKADTPTAKIIIKELPYTEGTVYLSASEGANEILKIAIEVESDTIEIPVDFSKVINKSISIKAFQDMNKDKQLNFDSYGRPSEPILQTKIKPKEGLNEYTFKLSLIL